MISFRRCFVTTASVFKSHGMPRGRPTRENRSYRHKEVKNAGVQKRFSAMREDGVDIDNGLDMDLLENSESDFFNVDISHRQFEKERELRKELTNLQIVGNKYFIETVPNFLTWSEKEHIRNLHRNSPTDWTPEVIAERFPTTADGVRKLLKVDWKPATTSRINRHDSSALRNWKELKEGTLQGVNDELKSHILKFTRRTIPPRDPADVAETAQLTLCEKRPGEFSRIITDYGKAAENTESSDIESKNIISNSLQNESEKNDTVSESNKRMTLEELRLNISKEAKINSNVSFNDNLILSNFNEYRFKNDAIQIESNTSVEEYESQVPQINQDTKEKIMTFEERYPERIRIPRKAFKRGVTYRVNDCFYDDDGRFLYRVPGMIGNNAVETSN